jgi:transcriptional regulator with XRE-family HTH domain
VIDPDALRRIRTDRGLSQRRLAAAIGVDPLTVKRLEDGADPGDLPLRVLEQLAGCLAVPVQDLLRARTAGATGDLTQATGAALLAHGRTTITRLACALSATVDDIAAGPRHAPVLPSKSTPISESH